MWLVGSKFPNQWLNPGPWSESAESSLLNHQGIPWILKNILPVFIYLGPWTGCCSFSSPLSYTHLSSLSPCFLFDLLKALTFPLRMILAMIHEFFLALCSLLFLFVGVTSANQYSIIMMETMVVIIISSILVNFILKIKKKFLWLHQILIAAVRHLFRLWALSCSECGPSCPVACGVSAPIPWSNPRPLPRKVGS